MPKLTYLQEEILKILQQVNARYSKPLNSFELAKHLNITPSYIRQTILALKKYYRVGVRRGSGGGFFLREH